MNPEPRAIEVLALGGFVMSGGFISALLDKGWPRLGRFRWGRRAPIVAPETEADVAEPAWWPQFERAFADYRRTRQ